MSVEASCQPKYVYRAEFNTTGSDRICGKQDMTSKKTQIYYPLLMGDNSFLGSTNFIYLGYIL